MHSRSQAFESAFDDLFGGRSIASAFVRLDDLDTRSESHPELTHEERRRLAGFSFEKRRRDWLGGRLAAKQAIARLVRRVNTTLEPEQLSTAIVEIQSGATGEPCVYCPPSNFRSDLQVSISHSGSLAGAVACRVDGGRIGFDLERVEAVEPALYSLAFLDAETRAIESAPAPRRTVTALALWTAKEAVSKAVGKGLSLSLKDIQLELPEAFFDEGALSAQLAARVVGIGPPDLDRGCRCTVKTCCLCGYVVSLASIDAS